jgi:penicillin-binding protein 1C
VRRFSKVASVISIGGLAVLLIHLACLYHLVPLRLLAIVPLRPIDLARPNEIELTDRKGVFLRHIPASDGTRSDPVTSDEIPLMVIDAFIAAEDKRFLSHGGYDPLALVRSFISNVKALKVVSGASTITQQLVRISYPRKRTVFNKILEIFSAVKAEHLLTKEEILRHYLNRVPMGKNIHGVSLACRQYFDIPLSLISLEQSAFLAAIPQSPGRVRGASNKQKALFKRQRWILQRMLGLGFIEKESYDRALEQKIEIKTPRWPFLAPHFTEMVMKDFSGQVRDKAVTTTLDADFQRMVEKIVSSRVEYLSDNNCTQMAVVIIENQNAAVRAFVGSKGLRMGDYGWNDGALTYRSAGSALKPFAYACAIERGIDAAVSLRDIRRTYSTPLSDYRPLNFSRDEHGPVLMRQALGASLNLPAIDLLMRLGVDVFFSNLKDLGFNPIIDNSEHYGLGLVIGNMEVRLLDLCAAFATLARGGVYLKPRFYEDDNKALIQKRVYSEETSFIITDMLADPSPRILAFGRPWYLNYKFPVAMKTGTSTSFRDCWMVAYTPEFTVGCWAGNFNGAPTKGLTGAHACGPLIHSIIENVFPQSGQKYFMKPPGVVEKDICSVSGCVPSSACPHFRKELFVESEVPFTVCQVHRDESPDLVFLSPEYATWTSKQRTRGVLGRYRLDGEIEIPGVLNLTVPDSQSISSKSQLVPVSSVVELGGMDFTVSEWPEGVSFIQIRSPLPVDRFVLDASREKSSQVIRLQADVLIPVEEITWYIDGTPYAVVGPPYETLWTLTRGEHRIVASCSDGSADAVTVSVE